MVVMMMTINALIQYHLMRKKDLGGISAIDRSKSILTLVLNEASSKDIKILDMFSSHKILKVKWSAGHTEG